MTSDDTEAALTSSVRYRMAMIGLRLGMIAFPSIAILVILARLGAPAAAVNALVKVFFAVAILGVLTGWLGAVLLARRTSRYSGASSGNIDFARTGSLAIRLIKDICNFRRW